MIDRPNNFATVILGVVVGMWIIALTWFVLEDKPAPPERSSEEIAREIARDILNDPEFREGLKP